MEFDLQRPCSSKTRAINRYSKEELKKIAESWGVSKTIVSRGSIDALCASIREKTSSFSKTLEPTLSLKVASPHSPTPTCLMDISRPCGYRNKANPAKNRYHLKDLKELWKGECKDLAEFAGKSPKTIPEFCFLLRQRYARMKFVAVQTIPEKIKERIRAWVVKKTSSTWIVTHVISRRLQFQMYKVRFYYTKASEVMEYFFNPTSASLLEDKEITLDRLPACFDTVDFNPTKAVMNPKYLYNRNVDRFPHPWFKKQNEYILGLSWRDKIRLLSYTYAGDKISNSFLLNTFDVDQIIDSKFLQNYQSFIFPLAVDMYLHARTFSTYKRWKAFCMTHLVKYTENKAEEFFLLLKTESLPKVYDKILHFLNAEGKRVKETVWYLWAGEYILHLNAIFAGAPRVTEPFYVYRGVKDASFVNANTKNVFVNDTFMSTSLGLGRALKFKKATGPCCLFSIQVLPGAQCLFVGALTYFVDEIEILFAPGRHLFITKTQYTASNHNVLVTRFSLLN